LCNIAQRRKGKKGKDDEASLCLSISLVYNQSFVLMEYFGYLRRDMDQSGFEFWVNVLNNRDAGNYRGMVCSFLTSTEYQRRFSTAVTRSNAECGR